MAVKEYLLNNTEKAAYTVHIGRKSYLCNLIDCAQSFGNMEIKKIGYGKNLDGSICKNLPILYLNK